MYRIGSLWERQPFLCFATIIALIWVLALASVRLSPGAAGGEPRTPEEIAAAVLATENPAAAREMLDCLSFALEPAALSENPAYLRCERHVLSLEGPRYLRECRASLRRRDFAALSDSLTALRGVLGQGSLAGIRPADIGATESELAEWKRATTVWRLSNTIQTHGPGWESGLALARGIDPATWSRYAGAVPHPGARSVSAARHAGE